MDKSLDDEAGRSSQMLLSNDQGTETLAPPPKTLNMADRAQNRALGANNSKQKGGSDQQLDAVDYEQILKLGIEAVKKMDNTVGLAKKEDQTFTDDDSYNSDAED